MFCKSISAKVVLVDAITATFCVSDLLLFEAFWPFCALLLINGWDKL